MSVQSIHLRFKWRVFHFYCLPHPLFSSPKIASIFGAIEKIYCLNSDLTVSGMAALKTPVSKFYLTWSIAHSYPSCPASLSLPYQPPFSPLSHTHFSLSIKQDPLCWDNSEGDYCHWILNQDTISTVESASEPPVTAELILLKYLCFDIQFYNAHWKRYHFLWKRKFPLEEL